MICCCYSQSRKYRSLTKFWFAFSCDRLPILIFIRGLKRSTQGNHYNTPGGTNSSGGSSYHYSNSNGSYYYANDNGKYVRMPSKPLDGVTIFGAVLSSSLHEVVM
eukprot:2437415-Pyramimonas_sp.AAC.1